MQSGSLVGTHSFQLCKLRVRASPRPTSAGARHPLQEARTRLCGFQCSAQYGAAFAARVYLSSLRTGRRRVVSCRAAARNFYDLLGVPQSASDRDIKSAYRKLAMKLHPDVNKAPDAQKSFMEVKVAYETLSDARQRAEYDRRLRMGGYSSSGRRTGSGASGFGGTSNASGGWGSYGSGPSYTQEPVPGLDDLIRELEREYTAWVNQRSKDASSKSLLEELEDLGGELLDFLEESLGIKDEQPASPSGQRAGNEPPRDTRSAAERFDAYWQQYGEAKASGGTGPSSGATSSSSTSSRGAASSSSAGAGASSSSSTYSSGTTRPPPKKSTDDDIEAELLALKKKLNKL